MTLYDEASEDQISPNDVLKHDYKDELVYDDEMYHGETINQQPNSTDVEPPVRDM